MLINTAACVALVVGGVKAWSSAFGTSSYFPSWPSMLGRSLDSTEPSSADVRLSIDMIKSSIKDIVFTIAAGTGGGSGSWMDDMKRWVDGRDELIATQFATKLYARQSSLNVEILRLKTFLNSSLTKNAVHGSDMYVLREISRLIIDAFTEASRYISVNNQDILRNMYNAMSMFENANLDISGGAILNSVSTPYSSGASGYSRSGSYRTVRKITRSTSSSY